MRVATTALAMFALVLAGCNRAPSKDWSFEEPNQEPLGNTQVPSNGELNAPPAAGKPEAVKPLSGSSSSPSQYMVQETTHAQDFGESTFVSGPDENGPEVGTIEIDGDVDDSIGTEILLNLQQLSN